MQEVVAVLAIPVELVDLAGVPLALDDQREGIGRETRRMRDAGRHPVRRTFGDNGDLFLALWSAVMKVHRPLDHIGDFVAAVDVEFAAIFASAGDEGERARLLPEHLDPLSALGQFLRDLLELDYRKLVHPDLLITMC